MMRIIVLFIVAATVILASNTFVQAETGSWDAYMEFNSSDNDSANLWSYYAVGKGNNNGYGLLSIYGLFPYNSFNGWFNGDFPAVGISDGEVKVHPNIDTAAVVGWKSPISGFVNASFSIYDDDAGADGPDDHPSVPYDGVTYALFKGGDIMPLTSGYIANGGHTGTINVDGISVLSGDMLYLQVGDGSANHWYDKTGLSFAISEVPEPSTMVLLVCGLLGLLACTWRKKVSGQYFVVG